MSSWLDDNRLNDNKYLATTLAKIRQDQFARDEEKLTRLKTLREKRKLETSLDSRRQGQNPTLLLGAEPDIPTLV